MPNRKQSLRGSTNAAGALDQRIASLERLLQHNQEAQEMLNRVLPDQARQSLITSNRATRVQLQRELTEARVQRENLI